MSMESAPKETPERQAYYDRLAPADLAALWTRFPQLVSREPQSPIVPHLWRYDAVRALLMEAGELITAKEAERRVLILENPGLPGQSRITRTLYAGLQLVLPGEIAPAHRHTQTALRFVMEGEGAHTAVDGEKTIMRPGDFVITPNWAWHDHGNDSADPMIWMDGLDIPLVQMLDASFAEGFGADEYPRARPAGDNLARFGQGMLPVGYERGDNLNSPVFSYPYDRSREALETLRRSGEWDACHGVKLRYVNPATGDWAMPTMGACLQLLPKGFETAAYRSTDASVFTATEGSGVSRIGDETIEWGPRDIFVVPSWTPVRHEANEDAVLFSFSDRPVQEKLGLFREDRGNA
ncbi:MAG: gentisate 1,2-dioxygenase [Marivibrio sp.]|uniref:gentisate 1,2-dioxygenase n=1 Tax=Marivibrio sp. TaxID=2039719 RepID=UPI0032ECD399